MIDVTFELLFGWTTVILIGFIVGEYTDVFARAAGLGKAAPVGGSRTKRALRLGGGLAAGLWFGPMVWSWAGGILAGSAGALALSNIGLTTTEILLVVVIAIGVFIFASRREDDD